MTDVHDGREPYTGQVGGRVSATQWPLRSNMALDVYFDGKDTAYPAGYYRGVIDTATTPSKTGIQKLDVDFPDDRTSARLDLKRSQVYDPGTEPAEPGAADGEVARAVPAGALEEIVLPAVWRQLTTLSTNSSPGSSSGSESAEDKTRFRSR